MVETVVEMLNKIMPYAAMPMGIAFLVLVILHASKMLGAKPALKMVGVGLLIAYALEEFGVHTGIIYGRYYFTSMMGPKLDVIPVALVCLWILLLYL
ncbi:MAG: carotenoid biosynthesis protein, partial [Prevotellaceae bacterium]|nr:carotenoid biosynthesis protein [Prevotellaceae bacterium]